MVGLVLVQHTAQDSYLWNKNVRKKQINVQKHRKYCYLIRVFLHILVELLKQSILSKCQTLLCIPWTSSKNKVSHSAFFSTKGPYGFQKNLVLLGLTPYFWVNCSLWCQVCIQWKHKGCHASINYLTHLTIFLYLSCVWGKVNWTSRAIYRMYLVFAQPFLFLPGIFAQ